MAPHHSDSEPESEADEVEDLTTKFKPLTIDVSQLTPLSPEVISKQVRLHSCDGCMDCRSDNLMIGDNKYR